MNDGWMNEGDGPKWLPVLNAVEVQYSIPANLLARMAYQESSFRPGVISGLIKSKPGAVGIMQLMPQFFPGAGVDPATDIMRAGKFLSSLHSRFSDWQVAVAAYNWGGGNVHHEYTTDADQYELQHMPIETQNYVKKVFADVPLMGALLK